MTVVSALYVYPIKSCRGIRVEAWPVVERGFHVDRRWMIVDAEGRFVSQRERAELSQVVVALEGERLQLNAKAMSPLVLPLRYESGEARSVSIWDDQARALVERTGSAWFSRYLGAPHQLVYMPDDEVRRVNPKRALPSDLVGFADAYPFLLISEASLADLNARLATPMGMERFRPNIVISGCAAFAEDEFARVRIGELTFRGPKRCDRCVVTTVDPETGERGKEPLRTLASYRLEDQKVWFGMNLIHDRPGTLKLGDAVEPMNPTL